MNTEEYIALLNKYVPVVIESTEEYNRAMDQISQFWESDNKAERAFVHLLAILVQDYEKSLEFPEATPVEVLQYLMEMKEVRQIDLVKAGIGTSGIISDICNGKKSISKKKAKLLADFFNVSPALFI